VRAILGILWLAGLAVGSIAADTTVTNQTVSGTTSSQAAGPKQPETLPELLAIPVADLGKVDIARINLLCAQGLRGAEELDVQFYLNTLDGWVRHVDSETRGNFHRFAAHPGEYNDSLAYYRMEMLATVLQQDFGAQYNPARAVPQLRGEHEPSDVFFADSKDVFLNGLLGGNHQGTCSSLPVLYVAVAQRLGYPVSLASARGHFYVRYDDGPEHLNVDATTLGFKTETDEFYRHWPQPVSDEEARTYGLLRPMTKGEILGSFLTIRAATLTSMKRFAEAAATWKEAARFLPDSPALKRIVERAFARAKNERNADRWDQLWDEVSNLDVRPDADYAYFRDRQIRLHWFMNQTTNLPAVERALADLKSELDLHRRLAMLASDSPATLLPPQRLGSEPPNPPTGDLPLARPRVRIPAERVPPEYCVSIPQELRERLSGKTREEDIVSEMWAFRVEEINRANQEARARLTRPPPAPLPQNVRPEWLPEEYRQEIPAELRNRLRNVSGQAQIEWTAKQFQQEQRIRRQTQEMNRQIERQNNSTSGLTGPPIEIEIIPANTGVP